VGNLIQPPQKGSRNGQKQWPRGKKQKQQIHCDIHDVNESTVEKHDSKDMKDKRQWGAKDLGTGSLFEPGPGGGANTCLSGWLCWVGQLTRMMFAGWCWLLGVGCLVWFVGVLWCGLVHVCGGVVWSGV